MTLNIYIHSVYFPLYFLYIFSLSNSHAFHVFTIRTIYQQLSTEKYLALRKTEIFLCALLANPFSYGVWGGAQHFCDCLGTMIGRTLKIFELSKCRIFFFFDFSFYTHPLSKSGPSTMVSKYNFFY